MTTDVLQAKSVEIRRGGKVIVPALNLDIPQGSLFGLVGPSGSGKTTIMRAMLGLGAIHGGEMSLLGLPVGHADLRQQIGYQPQIGGAWLDLTARECLQFVGKIYRVNQERIDLVLDLMELQSLADRPLATLSGGQERRVGLAMAILHQPPFLILDEPTVGLDPRLRHRLWTEFRDWVNAGSTIVVSTHVMDEAQLCDQIAVVMDGRVIALDSPGELIRQQNASDLESAVLLMFEKEANNVA